MKVLVYHRGYGCDTGCCGHAVALFPDDFVPEDKFDYYPETRENFEFSHPNSMDREELFNFAKKLVAQELGEEHVKDLDFENSYVVDETDWCG